MASVFAFEQFDYLDLDLSRLYYNLTDDYLYQDVYSDVNNRIYRDIYAVEFYMNGYYFESAFGGPFISIDNYGVYGTVTGYRESVYVDGQWYTLWGVQDFNVNASVMYDAALTTDRSDDYAIFGSILAGNDTLYLSDFDDFAFSYSGHDVFFGGGGSD